MLARHGKVNPYIVMWLAVAIGVGFLTYAPPATGEVLEKALEKICEYQFQDGVTIKVHFTDQILKRSQASAYFPKEVLDAAVSAYQTIIEFQGFSTPGYSFASPDKNYAYDPDRTIDIYLGHPEEPTAYLHQGVGNVSFKDAPCFDTVKVSEKQYQAVILLPANYQEFIKNWEKINPSPLGTRNLTVDLRGTLIHEMLHVILFYYNKNLNKDPQVEAAGTDELPRSKRIDWYVEGLARYFETLAGARHDFFSQGFKETLPDKIRFSRGGSNYFMRYPDQAFVDLRYENALFWRFIDYRYGMPVIEKLSRDLRRFPRFDFKEALEKATGASFSELLKTFAQSILFRDFGLKEDEAYLKDIAKTRLLYQDRGLYLVDGWDNKKLLGHRCQTDWIGRWDVARAGFGEFSVAGDSTEKSDVSGWATDFYEIDMASDTPSLPWLGVYQKGPKDLLAVQVFIVTRGGSVLKRQAVKVTASQSYNGLALQDEIKKVGLEAKDIEKIYLLITNTDPKLLVDYGVVLHP